MRDEISKLSDEKLLKNFSTVVLQERKGTVNVIVHLAEIYKRRLFAREGYSSLFSYIQDKYHYSGSSAYRRIQVARLSLRFPKILDILVSGKLNLVAISLIEPHITRNNSDELIEKTIGKTKQEIEYLLSSLFQREEKVQDKMRRLPVIKKVVPTCGVPTRGVPVQPIFPNTGQKGEVKTTATMGVKRSENKQIETKTIEIRRVKVEFVADEKVAEKIERARQVLRRKFPQGRLEDIINQALEDMLEKRDMERRLRRMEEKKRAKKIKPKTSTTSPTTPPNTPPTTSMDVKTEKIQTRYIPASLRRQVWKRDAGHCTFKSHNGNRCTEKNNIHVDHIKPWALNGKTTEANLRLLCAVHNQYRAQLTFGIRG